MSAAPILARLHSVRQSGTGWRADCPNGHSKARGSLAINVGGDGRVLLHCFACNDVPGILRTVGLDMADLFPDRINDQSPEARRAAREAFQRNAWRAALGVLARETTVICIAANDLLTGNPLAHADHARLQLAEERIHLAREVLA